MRIIFPNAKNVSSAECAVQSNQFPFTPSAYGCVFVYVYHLLNIQYAIICWCALLNFNEKKSEERKNFSIEMVTLNAQAHTVYVYLLWIFSLFFSAQRP